MKQTKPKFIFPFRRFPWGPRWFQSLLQRKLERFLRTSVWSTVRKSWTQDRSDLGMSSRDWRTTGIMWTSDMWFAGLTLISIISQIWGELPMLATQNIYTKTIFLVPVVSLLFITMSYNERILITINIYVIFRVTLYNKFPFVKPVKADIWYNSYFFTEQFTELFVCICALICTIFDIIAHIWYIRHIESLKEENKHLNFICRPKQSKYMQFGADMVILYGQNLVWKSDRLHCTVNQLDLITG